MGNLASAVDELAAEPLDGVADLGGSLVALRRDLDRLEAEWLRRVAAVDRGRDWQLDGAVSAGGWLREHCRMAPGAARERVVVARKLADGLAETAAAFAAGDVSYAHVRVIAAAADSTRAEAVRLAEPLLVEQARRLDPRGLRVAVTHWRHAVDAEAVLADANAAYERRRLQVSPRLDWLVVVDGQLDVAGGETMLAALEAVDPWTPDDTRSRSQRQADGLVELARRTLDSGDRLADSGGERPHVTVTVDLTTLTGADGAPAAVLDRLGPVAGETARRLACDAGVSRVVTDGASQPLDVGRRTRTIPAAIRRALIVRDGGCTHPRCDRLPAWTDAHHVVHWADGGPTSIDNLVLLCRRHHRAVHEGGTDPPHPRGDPRDIRPSPMDLAAADVSRRTAGPVVSAIPVGAEPTVSGGTRGRGRADRARGGP